MSSFRFLHNFRRHFFEIAHLRQRRRAGEAIGVEAVLGLKLAQRLLGRRTETAVRRHAEGLLQLLHGLTGAAGREQDELVKSHLREGVGAGNAIDHQAVLLLVILERGFGPWSENAVRRHSELGLEDLHRVAGQSALQNRHGSPLSVRARKTPYSWMPRLARGWSGTELLLQRPVRAQLVDRRRQMLGQLVEQLVDRNAERLPNLADGVVAQRLAELVDRDGQIGAVAEPG